MLSIKEKLNFLEDGVDFPFYNDIPKLSAGEWLLLLIAVIIMLLVITVPGLKSNYSPIIISLIMLIPALYVCKGNYSLFFKKPKKRDILTIILCVIAYYIYTIAVIVILRFLLSYSFSANVILTKFTSPSVFLIITVLMQLIGEEFFKIFLLLIVMYVVYKSTKNRGLSIALGVIFTLFIFGVVHSRAYSGRILQILLIQGLGSIFNLYADRKTKNVVVAYIMHLIVDFIPFTIIMLKSI